MPISTTHGPPRTGHRPPAADYFEPPHQRTTSTVPTGLLYCSLFLHLVSASGLGRAILYYIVPSSRRDDSS